MASNFSINVYERSSYITKIIAQLHNFAAVTSRITDATLFEKDYILFTMCKIFLSVMSRLTFIRELSHCAYKAYASYTTPNLTHLFTSNAWDGILLSLDN